MKPNILLLTIDSLRADRISPSNKFTKINSIEKLISNGIYCQNAISSSDSTGISIGSIFSSNYRFVTGINHYHFENFDNDYISALKNNNYSLYSTVPDLYFFKELTKSFDENNHYQYDKRDSWKQLEGGIGDQIVSKLKTLQTSENWFYFIHLMDLHQPFYLPKSFDNEIYGKTRYDKMISYIDTWIEKFLKEINLDNTLVILTADHGDYIPKDYDEVPKTETPKFLKSTKKIIPTKISDKFLHKLQERSRNKFITENKKNLSSLELRSFKNRGEDMLFDETIRIPLVLSSNFVENLSVNQLVRQIDIFPTIFELLDLKNEDIIKSGESFIETVSKKSTPQTIGYIESGSRDPKSLGKVIGIRNNDYKYFRDRDNLSSKHLYNLINDPLEEKNLANEFPDIVLEMENILQKILTNQINEKNEPLIDNDEKEIEEELKKLGYV